MSIVVWEWEDVHQVWTPYTPKTSSLLESCLASGKTSVNLGSAELCLSCYDVDLNMMTQTRQETGMTRSVRRKLYPSVYPCGQGIQWQWYNDINWVPYDIAIAYTIEKQYQTNRNATIDLETTSLGIPNFIDLKKMVQINKFTGFERPVERKEDASLKYPTDIGKPSGHSPNMPLACNNSSLPSASISPSTINSNHQAVNNSAFNQTFAIGNDNTKTAVQATMASGNDVLHVYCKAGTATYNLSEECSICFEKLNDLSGFHDDNSATANAQKVPKARELQKCSHKFHQECLLALIKTGAKDGWLQCPTCKVIQGVKQGNQPKDGSMQISRQARSLPGYPSCGMITITYDFKGGIQGQEHPHPGQPYYAAGFPRICYLPDNTKGQKVLSLLKLAWQRRLIFTVATSNTTGMDDTVVWNEIHHKTEPFSNISGHGYPDPNYLDNVLKELSIQGVDDSNSTQ